MPKLSLASSLSSFVLNSDKWFFLYKYLELSSGISQIKEDSPLFR